ncbi:DUF1266 domain-containing protein [Streptomyces antimycoticus]|uniref:DUF1266 domain-containing protein n=1 Tax=Streptomyces mordarskii TaxID=1226758 RepID=A0ABN1CSD8_9ACTN|nr:DUF1266 domain-containing protein [Streptomyces sp. AgN23]QTI89685.1 DUF1266 domain-containing protein [Streptomyces sp. AgN23]WTB04613.1 DUF1266 domain-containing protein [Streptomyces antimycoticus]
MGNGDGIAAGEAGPQAAWQAPGAVERQLYEAKECGDWPAYFDTLASADLFFADSIARIDAHPGSVKCTPYWYSQVRANCLPLLTEGMLPPPDQNPDTAFDYETLEWFAKSWRDDSILWLVINPGSPCEAFLPATPPHQGLWLEHANRVSRCDCGYPRHRMHLRALEAGGAASGPVAHGLGLVALLSVNNGTLWNSIAYHGTGYYTEKKRLKDSWDVHSRQQWQHTQESLLNADFISGVWNFALNVRRSLARDYGGEVELGQWRHAAERALRDHATATEYQLSPDGVTKVSPPSSSQMEGQIAGVQRLIGRIARYEERFRADGLLTDGQFVHKVEAWDYGRAAGMARWGLGARYCTQQEAEKAISRASAAGQASYQSWEEFSAAFILGRCLHFDDEKFGTWYQDMLNAHRILTTDPASPWLTIPWA